MADKQEEAPEWAKAEIADAVRILKEDGAHIHKTYAAFQKTLTGDKPPEGDPKDPPTEGGPPPEKPEPSESSDEKRPGLWWGKRAHDE